LLPAIKFSAACAYFLVFVSSILQFPFIRICFGFRISSFGFPAPPACALCG
jgi:hypothetical protein